MKVAILPVGAVPAPALGDLSDALAAYGLACHVRDGVGLPPQARDPEGARYDADAVLEALPSARGDTVLAVTTEDLFSGGYRFVFGLAAIGGARAVVSLHRLRAPDREQTRERMTKEAVHELGHAWGLRHCDDAGCVMAFSDSLAEVDAKGRDLCARCRDELPFPLARGPPPESYR